jgi:hypothetical protein
MRIVGCILVAFAASLVSACQAGLLQDMSRALGDPAVIAPAATSFVKENIIDVSWPQDPNADLCILQRALDNATPSFSTVYSGTDTNYEDTNCTDQGRYLYRLTKTRGTKSFGPSDAVMGVSSAVSLDSLEPNDNESQATPLTSTLAANLYYYSSVVQQNGAPMVTQDVDWYSVSVPSHRKANIVVTQDGLQGGSTNTWMYFYLKGTNPIQIVNNSPIVVTNYSDSATMTFLFKIYPIPSSFAANGGGSLITYTVSLNSIVSY